MRYLLIILCLPFIGLSQNIDKYNLDIARELGECYDKVVVDKETEISYPLCSDSTVRVFFLEPNYYCVYNESPRWCGSAGCTINFYKNKIDSLEKQILDNKPIQDSGNLFYKMLDNKLQIDDYKNLQKININEKITNFLFYNR